MAAIDNMRVGDSIYRQTFPPRFDDLDAKLLADRVAARDKILGPRVGDFVEFADGPVRRISHLTLWGEQFQTSAGGNFYLEANGRMDFSGSLFRSLPLDSLLEVDGDIRPGPAWFFHHNEGRAHNGVHIVAPCRVYRCFLPANR